MNTSHEKLLIAALAGLIIAGAAAFAVQPALATGETVESPALVTGIGAPDALDLRLWPAGFSVQTGAIEPDSTVWVTRCVNVNAAGTWCLVQQDGEQGWVNANVLSGLYEAAA